MYTNVAEVHRPDSLEEAVRLLSRSDVPTVPLFIGPRPPEGLVAAAAVVDVSRLGLDAVRVDDAGITLGAAASLEAVLRSPISGTPAGAFLAEACQTTAHSGLRAVASVGGVVTAGDPSDLLLALLALDAVCVVHGPTPREAPLAGFAPQFGELLVEVRVPAPGGTWGGALERVSRTPRDRSIVAAAAAMALEAGACARARLAVSGVVAQAARWLPAEKLLEGEAVTPERLARAAATVEAEARPADYHLGDVAYRRAAGAALARRALTAAWQRAAHQARA